MKVSFLAGVSPVVASPRESMAFYGETLGVPFDDPEAGYPMTEALAGVPGLLELPADRPRPAEMDHAGAQLAVVLDEELTAGIRALGRRHGTVVLDPLDDRLEGMAHDVAMAIASG